MKPRGLVLGNSHAACLREAWRQAQPAGFDLVFLAAHKEKMDGLAFADGHASAETSDLIETLNKLGMPTRIRLEDYDFFVVTACQVAMFRAVETSRRLAVWPEAPGPRTLVSGPLFEAALADALRVTTAYRLIAGVAVAGCPVLVLPQPNPHKKVLTPDSKFAAFRRLDGTGRSEWLAGMFRSACETAFAGLATVLHQPQETIAAEICTGENYCEGSIMLAAKRFEHKAEDVVHANARYGALQLNQIADAVGSMAAVTMT